MQRLTIVLFLFALSGIVSAQSNADCAASKDICKKGSYRIASAGGEGADKKEADLVSCFMNGSNFGQAEENSTWIKFEIEKSGTLAFSITPNKADNDIDFIVFKLPPDGDCRYKQIVRCMASGPSSYTAKDGPCMGPTGLKDGETDTSEDAGCADIDDNAWLAPLRAKAGEKYVILVSNVTESGPGFTINFSGSAVLPCEEDKKPVADKPKDKEKKPDPVVEKPKETPVVTTPPVEEKKKEIEGREVKVKDVVKVKKREITIKLWDSQVEDGDVISVFVDDKKVIDKMELKKKPREFKITLPPGKSEYEITVFADNFGKSEPNTATVEINDGEHVQKIDLVAGRKSQESVKVVLE